MIEPLSILLAVTAFVAGIVLFNLGHSAGYKSGYKIAVTHTAVTLKGFLDWLPGDDRMHFTNKLRDYQLEQFQATLVKILAKGDQDA